MSSHTITTFRYDSGSKTFLRKSAQRTLGLHEVLIKTTHSGICYTDVHAKDKGCGLGHEGVGHVTKVGDAVSGMKIGDRVGWGWLRNSCGNCPSCLDGYRQYCASARGFAFCDHEQGAFGDYHIIDAAFAYHIPESIDSADAGVFMCAGASTYEALTAAGTRPSDRVGVVGIGGLGHIAILFAKAMGCAVTALTSSLGSDSKEDVAFELGADELHVMSRFRRVVRKNPDGTTTSLQYTEAPDQNRAINVLLICSNLTPHFEAILPFLARRATIVLMSIQADPLEIPYMPFILPGHRLIASTEASARNHIDMIEFAARHQIKPWVEKFPMTEDGVKQAFNKLEHGRMRFRGVLEV